MSPLLLEAAKGILQGALVVLQMQGLSNEEIEKLQKETFEKFKQNNPENLPDV